MKRYEADVTSTGFELPGEGSIVGAGDERPVEARRTFGSVRRGYDPSEVDAFLAQVASTIQILEARSRDAARDDTLDDVTDRLAERFARIVALQEHEVETLLTEAHAEAARMVAEAEREAERIRRDARDAAERSVEDADAFREQAAVEADDLPIRPRRTTPRDGRGAPADPAATSYVPARP